MGDDELEVVYHNVPRRLLMYASLHGLIQFRFFPLLALIFFAIFSIIIFFALLYLRIQAECGLDLHSFVDAWLFSVLVHFKAVLSSSYPDAVFWHGCPVGVASLFSQLFIGNILMSVLLSSLVFNFQSLARRSISLFTTLTLGRRLTVTSQPDGDTHLTVCIVELNEMEKRKVTGIKLNLFAFDPQQGVVQSIATNVDVGEAPVPLDVDVLLPVDVAGAQPYGDCQVCGQQCETMQQLRMHMSAQSDKQHQTLIPNSPPRLSSEQIVQNLRKRGFEIIVIAEGQDAVTTDRIQVQKIYRNLEISSSQKPVSSAAHFVPIDGLSVDYARFL